MTTTEHINKTILKIAHTLSHSTFQESQVSYPGMVIFFSKLSDLYPSSNWDNIAHEYLSKIGKSIEQYNLNDISLNTGLTGLCSAVSIASKEGSRYTDLLSNLNSTLLDLTTSKSIASIRNDILYHRPSAPNLLNIFQGIAGMGFYCLNHLSNHLFREKAFEITELLNARCKVISEDFTLSYASGIAGLVSYLSWSHLKGISTKELIDTIQYLGEWIIDRSIDKRGFTSWPSSSEQNSFLENIGWLNGSAGIIRSLYIAGEALDDSSVQNYATDVFKENLFDTNDKINASDSLLINELAGLAVVTKKMALDTKDTYIERMSDFYCQKVSRMIESEIQSNIQSKRSSNKKLGLLDGVIGLGILLLEILNDGDGCQIPFLI